MDLGLNLALGGGRLRREISRYFTTLASAGSQHYTLPEKTVDRIVMDVYSPTGIATGLPTGAPTPTANKLETLDFTYSGTISELGKNGTDYFDGIIANVELYNGATLVSKYKLNEDMSTAAITDSSGNVNHGTAVNITQADAEKFVYLTEDNAWTAKELVVNGGFDNGISGWTLNNDGSIAAELNELHLVTGSSYPTDAQQTLSSNFTLAFKCTYTGRVGVNASGGAKAAFLLGDSPLFATTQSNATQTEIIYDPSDLIVTLRGDDGGAGHDFYFDDVSVTPIIEVA